jgi:hypothetical protein
MAAAVDIPSAKGVPGREAAAKCPFRKGIDPGSVNYEDFDPKSARKDRTLCAIPLPLDTHTSV